VDGAYGRPTELAKEQGDVLSTSLLPGFDLPLSRIFRDEV
jgi:hypothetical protein